MIHLKESISGEKNYDTPLLPCSWKMSLFISALWFTLTFNSMSHLGSLAIS